jgi:hypothetical protein
LSGLTILGGGQPVGRIYEETSASTPADMKWAGIVTNGAAPTLDQEGRISQLDCVDEAVFHDP